MSNKKKTATPKVVPPVTTATPAATTPPPVTTACLNDPCVIRIKRHIAGPPRRAPGQFLRMTPAQIAKQKLKEGDDFQYVVTVSKPA